MAPNAPSPAPHDPKQLAPAAAGDRLAILALLVVGAFVLSLSWFKLSSLDIGYHLAYGNYFLDHGGVVDLDPTLLPRNAVPFINANWGSQIIMAAAHRLGGAAGLIALRIALIACVFICITVVLRRLSTDLAPVLPPLHDAAKAGNAVSSFILHPSSFLLGISCTWLLAALAAYERFSMRPELFSYAVMTAMLVVLARRPFTWTSVLKLGLLQLLWVNLHSYFLVGTCMTAAWLVGEVVSDRSRDRLPFTSRSDVKGKGAVTSRLRRPVRSRRDPSLAVGALTDGRGPERTSQASSSRQYRPLKMLTVSLLVQICLCFVNPWHVHGAIFPLRTLQFLRGQEVVGGAAGEPSASAWSEISEFQSPFSFHGQIICARTIHAYYVLLAVAAVGLVALIARRRFGPAVLLLIFFAMSTQMRRNIAQFAMIAAPLSIAALAAFLRGLAAALAAPTSHSLQAVRCCLRGAALWFGPAARPEGRGSLGSQLDGARLVLLRFVIPLAITAAGGWLCYAAVSGRFYYTERRIAREFGAGYSDRTFLAGATKWLAAKSDLKPELFVDYFSSSNVLLWLPDRFRLFVNTNTFAVKDETLRLAFDLGLGEVSHNDVFDEYGVNVVLLHCGPDTQTLVRNLVADDGRWALVYVDPHAVIFVRRIIEHVPVILANQPTEEDLDADAWISAVEGPAHAKALALGTIINVPMSLGWSRLAARLAEEAARLAPDYFEAWHHLGVCHGNLGNAAARAGQYEQAVDHWKRAVDCFAQVLTLSPDHRDAAQYLRDTRERLSLLQAVPTSK